MTENVDGIPRSYSDLITEHLEETLGHEKVTNCHQKKPKTFLSKITRIKLTEPLLSFCLFLMMTMQSNKDKKHC